MRPARGSLLLTTLVGVAALTAACAAHVVHAPTKPVASASASAIVSASASASAAPTGPPPRVLRSKPWDAVPLAVLRGTGSSLRASVSLTPLEESVAAVDLVVIAVPDEDGSLVDVACTGGSVALEIDRSVFDAAENATGAIAIDLPLDLTEAARGAPASTHFAVRTCMREASGAIEGTAEEEAIVSSFAALQVPTLVLDTPSGPLVEDAADKGLAVIGWDVDRAALVLAHVTRAKDSSGKGVSFKLKNGSEIVAGPGRAFYVDKVGWKAAKDLAPGDLLVSDVGGTIAVETAPSPLEHAGVFHLEVDGPHDFFIGGVLASDTALDKKPPKKTDGESPVWSAPTESIAWVADAESYDCELATSLAIRAIPKDAKAVALAVQPSTDAGDRGTPTCDEGAVVRELPASLIGAAAATNPPAAASATATFAITLQEDEVQCEQGYALSVCIRGADGKLTPAEGIRARFGLSGVHVSD